VNILETFGECCRDSLLIAIYYLKVNNTAPTIINGDVDDLLANGREDWADSSD
jgi:hypothetical protein